MDRHSTAQDSHGGCTTWSRFGARSLFNLAWEGRGVPPVQNDEAMVTAYVRVVKDPTGVLWHSFQNENPVSTAELTASFGWESRQIFEQQDVQELSRKLMERLEEKMKGTPAEKALPELFVGKTKTYISCINVDYESSRVEDFWDIQLNVRNNKTLDDSFKDYIQVETLEGENKYDAGPPYGLQDAKKGVIFESFPPVLHLHLKRFEYDINRDAMMKINDRHAFPMEFDATPYLSNDADKSEPWVYQLHGVLVHSGDLNAGHYYAFLKPTKDGYWYRFDDDRVTRATDKEVLEENYGGEYELANGAAGVKQPYTRGLSTKRSMNAYMLVYIRKSRLDDVLLPIMKEDIPSHIETRLIEERVELARRKKEREEAHLYINVGVLNEESFKSHHGFDLTSLDLPAGDPALPKQYRILKALKVGEFAEQLAQEKGIDANRVRFWVMVNRQNKTTRPDQVIKDPDMSVEEAYSRFGTKGNPFRVWMEVGQPSADGTVSWPDNNNSVLVFLKHFDAPSQTLSGVGPVYVRKNQKVAELAPTILEKMEWPAGTEFMLYEEIKHNMIDVMKPKQTFQQSEIQDGDIITFQKSIKEADLPSTALYQDARQYYDYLLNRISVTFAPIKAGEGDEFTLTLSRKMTYDQFSKKVGEHLNVESTHLRFAPVMASTGKPKQFIKRNPNQANQTLYQILSGTMTGYGYSMHRSDALYYEVLETSLSDYESKTSLKVTWLPEVVEVLVPRDGTISDLLSGLQKKANLDEDTIREVRIYETHAGKIYRDFPVDTKIAGINEFVTLYAERMPEEEVNMGEGERTINAYNFDRDLNRPHGVPFKFVLKPVSAPYELGLCCILTISRVRSSKKQRRDSLSGLASRVNNLKRSSLPRFLVLYTRVRDISKTVGLSIMCAVQM
ncbi:unnamed protein product [Aspergillus oryzae var. brunneus]|uniref:ubiquitinyl hydrolase 1 n=1 Tax=Aspergillus oryzae var. brunneus TaxID=332754 RepID=A0ABQ6LEG0_ASPOZ|nr:unnamed protein product [Aspergillus oryzae]GMG54088.1 unnamed protein product [Aspergillus oryzae var. brunneus]